MVTEFDRFLLILRLKKKQMSFIFFKLEMTQWLMPFYWPTSWFVFSEEWEVLLEFEGVELNPYKLPEVLTVLTGSTLFVPTINCLQN